MTVRVSTGLRDKMLGSGRATLHGIMVANTISFDNASGEIRDSGSGLLTSGFLVGDVVYARGTSSNNAEFTVTAAVAGVLTVTPAPTDEAAGTIFALIAGSGGQFRDVMRNGVLRGYSGSQPTNADAAASGTLLLEITESGGVFVHGEAANGINWDTASAGTISKAVAETWKASGLATGTLGYIRICGNPADTGASSTVLPRVDMSVGTTSGADMLVATTAIVAGKIYYLNDGVFTFPYQYGI